ncbi:MAG: hypothetical protein SF070_14390 [Gemmatimonadota bacterium]|nr:hypothetical protein [Gemmatimonadota bacterium]
MMPALLLALLQAASPTVGDTIWIERRLPLPGGAEVRAAPWLLEGTLGLLGRPVVRRQGGDVIVAYPVVAWAAGTHQLAVPGPILIRADGRSDTLPAVARTIEVASVLPAGAEPERIAPQPEAGIVSERITSPLPLLFTLLVAGALFTPLAWWWLRRGPARQSARTEFPPVALPLDEWSEAGEHRAVAVVAARALRRTITGLLPGTAPGLVTSRLVRVLTEQRPQWPAEEIGTVLRALEAAEFAEHPAAEVVALAERATRLRQRLEGAA